LAASSITCWVVTSGVGCFGEARVSGRHLSKCDSVSQSLLSSSGEKEEDREEDAEEDAEKAGEQLGDVVRRCPACLVGALVTRCLLNGL